MSGSTRWLVVGALSGILAATIGLATGSGDAVPEGAVAVVNGETIPRDDYERALAALDADRRGGLAAGDPRRALDRLIDEELLVQRALEMGLPRHDAKIRGELTAAVIRSVVMAAEDVDPSEEELRDFYERERPFFRQSGRIHAHQVFLRVSPGADEAPVRRRAEEAVRRLRDGEPLAEVASALGDRALAPLPDGPLPPAKLLDYLGPTVLRTLLSLEPSEVSAPVRSGMGLHVLRLIAREPDRVPPFEEIRESVHAHYRRRAGERALREYLDGLRERATLVVAPGPP